MVMIYLLISIGYKNKRQPGIAENLFGVSQSLGTKTGFYIGERIDKFIRSVSREEAVASSRDIILFSLLLAAKVLKGLSVIVRMF